MTTICSLPACVFRNVWSFLFGLAEEYPHFPDGIKEYLLETEKCLEKIHMLLPAIVVREARLARFPWGVWSDNEGLELKNSFLRIFLMTGSTILMSIEGHDSPQMEVSAYGRFFALKPSENPDGEYKVHLAFSTYSHPELLQNGTAQEYSFSIIQGYPEIREIMPLVKRWTMPSIKVTRLPDNDLSFECPHCLGSIVVSEKDVNCAIFRHATFKDTLKPIDPHAPKNVCTDLVAGGKVYGCGKPFRLVVKDGGEMFAEKCEYV